MCPCSADMEESPRCSWKRGCVKTRAGQRSLQLLLWAFGPLFHLQIVHELLDFHENTLYFLINAWETQPRAVGLLSGGFRGPSQAAAPPGTPRADVPGMSPWPPTPVNPCVCPTSEGQKHGVLLMYKQKLCFHIVCVRTQGFSPQGEILYFSLQPRDVGLWFWVLAHWLP